MYITLVNQRMSPITDYTSLGTMPMENTNKYTNCIHLTTHQY